METTNKYSVNIKELDNSEVELVGVEAGGKGLASGEHAARLAGSDASQGVAQGYKTMFLQDDDGQVLEAHSISAGLDYCSGDAVVVIDADLQDPPEIIPEFISTWQQGYDVVYGLRTDRDVISELVIKDVFLNLRA